MITIITKYRFTLNSSLFFVSMAKVALLFFPMFLFAESSKSNAEILTPLSICFLGFSVALILVPILSFILQKHLGTKWNLMRCPVALAVGMMGLSACKSLSATIVFSVILAFGTGYKKPAYLLCNISQNDIENEQTQKEMKEYSYAGVIIGVVLSIAGVMFLTYKGLLFVVSVMLIFFAGLNLIFIKDTTPKDERMASYPIVSAKKVFSDGAFAFIKNQFLNILIGFVNMMLLLLIPISAVKVSDFSVLPWNVGILSAFVIFANRFMGVFKSASHKHNTKAVFFVTALLGAVSFLLYNILKTSMLSLIAVSILTSFFVGGITVTKKVLAVESLTPSAKDAENSIISQVRSVGAVVACVVSYLLAQKIDLLFFISCIVLLFMGLFVLISYRTPKE